MSAAPISPEEEQRTRDALSRHATITAAAEELGIPRTTMSARSRRLSQEQANHCDTFGLPHAQLKGGWFKNDEVSFRFTVPEDSQTHDDYVQSIKDALSGNVGASAPTAPPVSQDALLTRYVLADIHFGMVSWGEQTGQDYDLKIAAKYLNDSITSLLDATPNSNTALILNIGDTFHANDSKNETPGSGHQLDVDGRFPKIALATVTAIRRVIDMALTKHKHVEYVGIQGNHDPDQTHWLNIALMMHYEGNPRVKVRWNPTDFFNMVWGRNLLTAHHGDKAKFERLAMFIADHFAVDWGKTYWRFCDTGHIHHESEKDVGGVKFRSYRTIAARDAYAFSHAYSARQTLTAITVHKEQGEISEHHVNIYPERRHEQN